MSKTSDYFKVTSQDGYDFYLEKSVMSKQIPEQLPYGYKVVEKILQYMHYKHQNMNKDLGKLPPFSIDPQIALEVLKAAIELKI